MTITHSNKISEERRSLDPTCLRVSATWILRSNTRPLGYSDTHSYLLGTATNLQIVNVGRTIKLAVLMKGGSPSWVPRPGSRLQIPDFKEPETVEILAARKSIGIPIKRHRKYYRGHLQPCSSRIGSRLSVPGSIVLSINFHTWHFFVMLIRPPSRCRYWCWNRIGHLKYLL